MMFKSVSCQEYSVMVSSCSDTSASSSSSSETDTRLKRFNRLLRESVARRWAHFRRHRQHHGFARARSVSDAAICTLVHTDPDLSYLDVAAAAVAPRLSLQPPPPIRFTIRRSAGSGGAVSTGAAGGDEASDSEPERRRSHHLRVPTPVFTGQSTGNFSAGGGGGSGARSAPATPLQLDAHPHHHHQHQATNKHDKHALKPVSGSAPSVRGGEGGAAGADGKQPSKARQKKFQRHFPQVGPEEKVLNYYSCALVGDLLLQGHLYITKNYFAFYSNVFGYVTKLLIPTTSVLRITKEKVARIIPNAVGVCTRDERHVFGSLLSRDATYKLMTHVWKASRVPELAAPKADLRTSEVELDASEYSLEDDSSSGGGDQVDSSPPIITRESEAIITTSGGAAIIQPALLTGSGPPPPRSGPLVLLLWLVAALLACSAAAMAARLYLAAAQPQKDLQELSGEELYEELVRWRARLHGRAASELHAFLTTNLLLLTKVRQSLEALSGVILTDMGQSGHVNIDVPNDTGFS